MTPSAASPANSPADTVQPSVAFMQRFTLPPGKLYLLHGAEPAFRLTHNIAYYALRRGMRVAVADGGNWFNVHALIQLAQTARQNPDALLRSIFVSRSFTCYQMEQTITHLLPVFLKSIDSPAAIILGLLDTLYDEQAPLREVRQILRRILSALHTMKADGISILVTALDHSVLPEERNQLFTTLARAMDDVYRLEYDNRKQPLLIRETPSSLSASMDPSRRAGPPASIDQIRRARIMHHPSSDMPTTGTDEPYLSKGVHYGTHRTDIHQYHRQRTGKLVQVPPRPSS